MEFRSLSKTVITLLGGNPITKNPPCRLIIASHTKQKPIPNLSRLPKGMCEVTKQIVEDQKPARSAHKLLPWGKLHRFECSGKTPRRKKGSRHPQIPWRKGSKFGAIFDYDRFASVEFPFHRLDQISARSGTAITRSVAGTDDGDPQGHRKIH